MSNEEIGEAYRQRWAIEVLWKFLKMHLKLDKMMSKNLNGITIQIYAILIVYLILHLLKVPRMYGSKLGCVDLLFEPKESTDKIEKAQEVSGQFIKMRKEMSVLL